jgi:FkbM family methyltransferase
MLCRRLLCLCWPWLPSDDSSGTATRCSVISEISEVDHRWGDDGSRFLRSGPYIALADYAVLLTPKTIWIYQKAIMIKLPHIYDWNRSRRAKATPRGASPMLVEKPNTTDCIRFSFAGHAFAFHEPSGTDMSARAMQTESYEAPLPIMWMAAVARSQGLFVDIGANNGLYSILAAKIRPDANVIAFEPYPPAHGALLANLALNSVEANVFVHKLALSDSAGETTLYVPDGSHGLLETSASLEPDFQSTVRTITVRKAQLDDIGLNTRIAVMKIDVEGHEAAVLRGASRCLEQDRPIVFAEMLPGAESHFLFMTELFAGLDYLMFRLRLDCAIQSQIIRFDHLAWNYAFVPRATLPIFRECCATHGVEILVPA